MTSTGSSGNQSMCGAPELTNSSSSSSSNNKEEKTDLESNPSFVLLEDMNHLTVETVDNFSSLLELAASNDLDGFRRFVDRDPSSIDMIDVWYGRKKGTNQMVLEHRTPLMVAATYGSVEVLTYILSYSTADINLSCEPDKSTALHCAASSGSCNAVEIVKLLLLAGADPNVVDANGLKPVDVILVSPRLSHMKIALEELLATSSSSNGGNMDNRNLRLSTSTSNSNSPPLSPSPDNGSPSSGSDSTTSLMNLKYPEISSSSICEKKEYPIDPSLPDIKNSFYATDEFRMFSFKVRPCSRAYSHDWTECPFVHPGENARRRDPRKYHYSCVPCPDFRKGACRRGDLCEYAHGVFECWLHPAQYRTRLCKDGTICMRRVCFFAHTSEELRPLYMSTGSAVPSPRSSTAAMEMAAAINMLPGSPSSVSVMSPSPFTPPMSPSANGMSHSSLAWAQPNVPTLHLPGSNLQSSRLRSSFNARDIPIDDFEAQQLLNDFACFSQNRMSSLSGNLRSGRLQTLSPSNLDELFRDEISSSPRFSDQTTNAAAFPSSHKTAVLNQFQQQQQSMLAPINTTNVLSPKAVDSHSLLQASFNLSSSGRMSPRGLEPPISPINSRISSLTQREKQQLQLRSLSSRDLGSIVAVTVGSPATVAAATANSWGKWGSPSGKLDWGVNGDELGKLHRSSSFEALGAGEEPDLSWVQSLVKESPPEIKRTPGLMQQTSATIAEIDSSHSISNLQLDAIDPSLLGALLEQMQLDQLVAQ